MPSASKINDFTLHVATANGSGSQSSNLVIMRSIFNMGIPVCGKNLFPSNIQGLPTWFTTRVNKEGFTALSGDIDVLVAMNKDTNVDDIKALVSGSVVITEDEDLKQIRSDLIFYIIPFNSLAGKLTSDFKMRRFLTNMIAAGVVSELFGIEREANLKAIEQQFSKKPKVVESNMQSIDIGRDYVRQNLKKMDSLRVERMSKTKGKIIIDGNTSCAFGALNAGCTVISWYPITPSSSLCETATSYFERYRKTSDGKNNFAVIQAEDELAALGMAIGAGWTGARAMTSSSGPGLSLMSEFVGLAYFAEVPVVIFDVQRIGPSTGLPTRTSQGDLLFLAYHSHGDTKHPLLIPANVEECYEFSQIAFDIAESYQCPVFVMTDLDLGMNYRMSEPFKYPTKPFRRGKVLSQKELEKAKDFKRYGDPDDDGIPYRILPGTRHPLNGYLTRGSGHNAQAVYSEKPEDYTFIMGRLAKKFKTLTKDIPAPEITDNGNDVGLIYFGSPSEAVRESVFFLEKNHRKKVDSLRLRGFPFHDEVKEFILKHKKVVVVEMNRDAQMKTLLLAELQLEKNNLVSLLDFTGHPLSSKKLTQYLLKVI